MTRTSHALRPLFLIVFACALLGCYPAIPKGPMQPTLGPGPLRVPQALAWDFEWRQRVTAQYPTGTSSFEAVLQHRDGTLRLIGLSPMGLPGFIITLDAQGRITMDNRSNRELPFSPSYILADVQRAFFPWLPTPSPNFSGIRTGAMRGLQVQETFKGGVLQSRTFRRDDAPERGVVKIRYTGWQPGQDAPAKVVMDNGWFGYVLTIETVEQDRL